MPKEDKYYYLKRVDSGWNARRAPQLIRWNLEYQIDLDEEVDSHQNIDLTLNN
jgi:hypothetical protein